MPAALRFRQAIEGAVARSQKIYLTWLESLFELQYETSPDAIASPLRESLYRARGVDRFGRAFVCLIISQQMNRLHRGTGPWALKVRGTRYRPLEGTYPYVRGRLILGPSDNQWFPDYTFALIFWAVNLQPMAISNMRCRKCRAQYEKHYLSGRGRK